MKIKSQYFKLLLILITFLLFCRENNIPKTKGIIITKEMKRIKKIYSKFNLKLNNHALKDWRKLQESVSIFFSITPENQNEIQKIIKLAYKNNIKLRFRAQGHSMNGSSLPKQNELLIFTSKLTKYKLQSNKIITIEVGISLFSFQYWLKQQGYKYNFTINAPLGPSLGGLIASGGISLTSKKYGGLWENIDQIKFIDGTGKFHVVNKKNKLFKWFFGSMGQLGFITEINIPISTIVNVKQNKITSGVIKDFWASNSKQHKWLKKYKEEKLYWYTILAPRLYEKKITNEIKKIMTKHPKILKYIDPYIWPIKFLSFNPPLIYPKNIELVAIGIWGHAPDNNLKTNKVGDKIKYEKKLWRDLLIIEKEINSIIKSNPFLFRRYIQSEIINPNLKFSDYFGIKIYNRFQKLKKKMDPKNIFNEY